jgi:hypothetical protein
MHIPGLIHAPRGRVVAGRGLAAERVVKVEPAEALDGAENDARPPAGQPAGGTMLDAPVGHVFICAGVPGKPELTVKRGKPYPSTTTDVAKLLAEQGFDVAFEDERDQRCYTSFYAAEIWLPILQFGEEILSNGLGGLLGVLLIGLVGERKPKNTILHVEFRVVRRKGGKKTLKASGKADDVLKAMETFEREIQDD